MQSQRQRMWHACAWFNFALIDVNDVWYDPEDKKNKTCSEIGQEANIVPHMHCGENFDSFLQPTDISILPETMQQSFEQIYSITPSEGNKPVPFFKDKTSEQKAFLTLFPTGQYGLNVERTRKISMTKYFNNRLLNADPRFATDPSYIFFSQYMSERNQVASKLSIALRKGCPISQDGSTISKQLLASSANVNTRKAVSALYLERPSGVN